MASWQKLTRGSDVITTSSLSPIETIFAEGVYVLGRPERKCLMKVRAARILPLSKYLRIIEDANNNVHKKQRTGRCLSVQIYLPALHLTIVRTSRRVNGRCLSGPMPRNAARQRQILHLSKSGLLD